MTIARLDCLRVRAGQLNRLTWRQYCETEDLMLGAGLGVQVAAVTALLAADPQDAIRQLRNPRAEILAPGVVATVVTIDVLTAALLRSPESHRMTDLRHEGEFDLPLYTADPAGSELVLTLPREMSVETATEFYLSELMEIDAEVSRTNPYRHDITTHGIRVGGTLFPLRIEFPDQTSISGWETADGYGRTYFTQEDEGIWPEDVLGWLQQIPANPRDLATHPLTRRRAELLAVAGKVLAGSRISPAEADRLQRAIMPRTTLVLAVNADVPLEEARRQIVSTQHLDRPMPTTPRC